MSNLYPIKCVDLECSHLMSFDSCTHLCERQCLITPGNFLTIFLSGCSVPTGVTTYFFHCVQIWLIQNFRKWKHTVNNVVEISSMWQQKYGLYQQPASFPANHYLSVWIEHNLFCLCADRHLCCFQLSYYPFRNCSLKFDFIEMHKFFTTLSSHVGS